PLPSNLQAPELLQRRRQTTTPSFCRSVAPPVWAVSCVAVCHYSLAPCHSVTMRFCSHDSLYRRDSPAWLRPPSVSPCIAATPRLVVLTSQVLPSFASLLMICVNLLLRSSFAFLPLALRHSAIRHLILRFCLLLQQTSISFKFLEFWLA
ncbi:hypothetical protein S83_062718, partial [Arachis hypogaea]